MHFHAPDPAQDWNWHPPVTVTGRLRPKGPMMTIEEFSYARGRARVPVKITMPSPLVVYGAWSPEHSRPAYSDPFELFADAAAIIRAEAAELARLGCTYIQIDSPDLGTLVDPENRALREGLGMDTERTLTEGVDIINSVADVPGVTFGLHICKGNYESKWIATGGYEFTADKVFSRSDNFDVFLLEYDDERSGSFEPLANVPDDKMVVLGLVSSKLPGIEPVDELDRPYRRGRPLRRQGAARAIHSVRVLAGVYRREPHQRGHSAAQARAGRGGGPQGLVPGRPARGQGRRQLAAGPGAVLPARRSTGCAPSRRPTTRTTCFAANYPSRPPRPEVQPPAAAHAAAGGLVMRIRPPGAPPLSLG